MATLKTCFKCGAEKPTTDYYAHQQMADGLLGKCKECTKKDTNNNRILKADYYREYDRERGRLPHRIKASVKQTAKWRKNNPEGKAAQYAVAQAVKLGKMERLPCWICGSKAEAHHPDYSLPLDVVWLCSQHHKQAHAITRKP